MCCMDDNMALLIFTFLVFLVLHVAECTEGNKASFICEPGWELVTPNPAECVKLSEDKLGYKAAKQACMEMYSHILITRREGVETFIYDIARADQYWFGLYKSPGRYNSFRWQRQGDPVVVRTEQRNFVDRFPYQTFHKAYAEACGYMISSDRGWYATNNCFEKMNYICAKPSKCVEGYFGYKCNEECHCHREPCDVTGLCQYGCQMGWFGEKCNKKKEEAEVTYYCFNTTSKGARVLVRVGTKGQKYATLDALDEEHQPLEDCKKSTFSYNSDTQVYSKEMLLDPSQPDSTNCGARKIRPSTWVWEFALREVEGVQSLYDVIFKVTCDFSKADDLTIKQDESLKVSGKITSVVKEIDVEKEEVGLTLVDPVTQAELHEVELGTNVQLLLKLHQNSGISAKGVSPYNCQAFSADGKFTKQLSDETGCAFDRQPYFAGNSTVHMRMFPLFTFPGTAIINFRCEYEFCFQQKMKCDNRCRFYITNGRGRWKRSSNDKKKPVYTSVKVLQPQEQDLEVDPPPETPDKLRGVPLLYLNPITCSMFLFLLSVFLLYYVFFIKSLKKAVEEMKQELKLQNRWQRL